MMSQKVLFYTAFIFTIFLAISCKQTGIQDIPGEIDAIPFSDEDQERWGLVDMNGNIIVEKEWKSKPSIGINQTIRVRNSDNLYEYYQVSADPEQIGDEYIDGTFFNDGLAAVVEENGYIKYININGEEVFDLKEDSKGNLIEEAGVFSDGLARFKTEEGFWGYVNKTGDIAVDAKYDNAHPFSEGYGLVEEWDEDKNRTLFSFIDKNGKEIIKISKKITAVRPFFNGMAAFTDASSKDEWGFFDLNGEEVIKPDRDFNKVSHFRSDVVPFFDGDDWGLLDKKGEEVLRAKYNQSLVLFYGGLAPFEDDDEFGFIDIHGDEIIEPTYDNVLPYFSSNTVVYDRDYFFINKKGETISENEFDYIPIKDIINQFLGYKYQMVETDFFSAANLTSIPFTEDANSGILGFKLGNSVPEVMAIIGDDFTLPENDRKNSYSSENITTSSGITYFYSVQFDSPIMKAKKEYHTTGSGYFEKTVLKTVGYEINQNAKLTYVQCKIFLSGKAKRKTELIKNDFASLFSQKGFEDSNNSGNEFIRNEDEIVQLDINSSNILIKYFINQ